MTLNFYPGYTRSEIHDLYLFNITDVSIDAEISSAAFVGVETSSALLMSDAIAVFDVGMACLFTMYQDM